ncbi:MAG: lamin tail domain-containing protein, partial [Myxococcota bacterium]|nr:lamin tail domain-containing protein [Myxococcota bacterium]
IHAIGLQPADYGAMAAAGTALIWSPRSNITLYGETARVSTAARLGVEIALGTDWMPTGSMNLLRELKCADGLNKAYLGNFFSDAALWKMVTSNAASVTATDDVIGLLAPGKLADLAIFTAHGKTFRAVIDAEPADVVLVMRAGKTLYGDATAVEALATSCDTVDVCGTSKRVCLMSEVGKTYAALQTAAGANIYPAFSCGQPQNEPSCTPTRPTSVAGSTIYTGTPGPGDQDGDGLPDAEDKCPTVFDPIRPLDGAKQGDADDDGVGDVCDPCPLNANTTTCAGVDPNDRDSDGVPNSTDNCPDAANTNQADADSDGKGDVCDACPNAPNPGSVGCSATIYSIKSGMTPVGTTVSVVGALVTGRGSNGFFAQVKETDAGYMGADNSGLFVFTGAGTQLANATVGARVTIEGRVANFQGQIELDNVTAVTVTAAGPEALPAPIPVTYAEVKTGGTRALKLESVIVSLGAAAVSATNAMFGEFTLTAGADSLIVDDFLFVPNPAPTVGTSFMSVRGILTLRQMSSKLEPRDASDFTAGAPALASFGPALSYARVGTTANAPTFPTPLTVTLTGPAQGDTNVVITSGSADLVVASVTVPNGQTSVSVPVTAVAQELDVTVTAMLGVQMLVSHVRVLAATEGPTTVTLTPADTAVAPAGTVDFTVTLDVPALAGGAAVTVTATSGTVPATVTVPANQTTATFSYTNAPASGTAMVTATFDASSSSSTVTVSTGANHLVINEIDYDSISTDTTEYIEIFNPSTQTISLANLQVLLINGSGNVVYRTIDLAPATSLAPNQYLVIANANVSVPAAAKKIELSVQQDIIQNGAPDGLVLIDSVANVLIDALTYEG